MPLSCLDQGAIDESLVCRKLAAAADLGLSLTQRGISRNVVFVTPRVGDSEAASDWTQVVLAADTAVLYMASGQAEEISAALMAQGLPGSTPAALVSNASLPNMKKILTTLAQLPEVAREAGSPALIVLGEVLRASVQCVQVQQDFSAFPVMESRQRS